MIFRDGYVTLTLTLALVTLLLLLQTNASRLDKSKSGFGTFDQSHDQKPVNMSLIRTQRPVNTTAIEINSGQLQMGVASCVSRECRPVIGSVINIFPRYGYNSLTMKVVPRNDSEAWLFSEPFKANIFDMSTIEVKEKLIIGRVNSTIAIATTRVGANKTSKVVVNNGTSTSSQVTSSRPPLQLKEIHLQLCEDMPQLLTAYFRSFRIEGFDRPWNVFGAGWRVPSLVKFLGIDEPYTTNETEHFYLFARVSMVRRVGQSILKSNFSIQPQYRHVLGTLEVGNLSTATKFFNDVGTHYLSSYTTGNSLYQVFVFDRYGYEAIKAHLNETRTSDSSSSTDDEDEEEDEPPKEAFPFQDNYDGEFRVHEDDNNFQGVLSHQTLRILYYWVKHIGNVMVLNSSPGTVARIRAQLQMHFQGGSTNSSLFQMFDNETLLRKVEAELIHEDAEGLLGLELRNIAPIFRNESQRKWFQESLSSTMSLWENNL